MVIQLLKNVKEVGPYFYLKDKFIGINLTRTNKGRLVEEMLILPLKT